jgi:hypothetical protein
MRRFEAFILIRAGNSFDPRLVLISRKRHPLSPMICVYLHAKGQDEQEKAKEVNSDKSPIAHGSRSLGRRTRRRAMLDLALHELASEKAMEVADYFLFHVNFRVPFGRRHVFAVPKQSDLENIRGRSIIDIGRV